MAVLPLAKLGTLLLKTLSKPLANRIKKAAVTREKFREYIIAFAQFNHRVNVQMTRRIYGGIVLEEKIKPLNEEKALQTAADFIGEAVIFVVGGGIVLFEYNRQNVKEKAKEEARLAEKMELKADVERQAEVIVELQKRLDSLEEGLYQRPPPPRAVLRTSAPLTEHNFGEPTRDSSSSSSRSSGGGDGREGSEGEEENGPDSENPAAKPWASWLPFSARFAV